MFTFYFGNTNKKRNSTFQPDYSEWVKIENLKWKMPFEDDAPMLQVYYDADNIEWNYAYCPDYDNYYWVNSITSDRNNIWSLSLMLDPLATYKADIMNTKCYILFGNNADASSNRLRVIDNRQTIINHPVDHTQQFTLLQGNISNTGLYLVTAVGDNGCQMWALQKPQLDALNAHLNLNAQEYGEQIIADVGLLGVTAETFQGYSTTRNIFIDSALNAIKSCLFVPVSGEIYNDGTSEVVLGEYHTGITGIEVIGGNWTHTETYDIPWQFDDWQRMTEQLTVYIPFIGTTGLAIDKANIYDKITIQESYAKLTGEYTVAIFMGTGIHGYPVFTGSCNLGAPFAIGSSNFTTTQIINGTSQMIGSAMDFGAGALTGGSAGLTAGVYGVSQLSNAITTLMTPTIQTVGGIGGNSATGLNNLGMIHVTSFGAVDNTNFRSMYAHPVYKVAFPVGGYCQTNGFPSTINAKESIKTQVAQYMDTGVFIE